MISIFVHRDGQTGPATRIDPAWLQPVSGAMLVYFRVKHWI